MAEKFVKNVVYRCIGNDFNEGVIACGYMPKPTAESNQENFVIGYYSAFLLLSGSGTYMDSDGHSTAIAAGDCVQRRPGRVHTTRIHPDGAWLEFFVSFGKSVYEYMQCLSLLPQNDVTHSGYDITRHRDFDSLISRLRSAREDALGMLLPDIQKLALEMAQPVLVPAEKSTGVLIQSACDALSSGFSENISLEALSREYHMSYESFRKLFKDITGSSPARYRCEQRMKHARLLLSSGISIKETAEMVGYGDIYAFTKQFTKTVGMPPGKYIRQIRENVTS